MDRSIEAGPLGRPLPFRPTATAVLIAAWALLVGVSHALRPILPIDETRYVSVAWEMWTHGDFLVPHLNGLPYSEKPPLLFWLMQLGWWAFGVNDWWPRLVPGLVALANLFLTGALARRLWPDRPQAARLVPAILLGFFLWSLFTTLIMFDMLVAFCALVALLGIHEARVRGGWVPWVGAGAALGLGLLAKGPVAVLLPLLVAVLEPWWGRGLPRPHQSQIGRVRWWLGLAGAVAIAAAIGLSWALPAAAAGGEAYSRAILLTQAEERIVRAFAHQHPWWWYLPLLPLLTFPYSLWPPLWKAAARMRPGRLDAGQRFCLAWIVPGLAVFSAISGKQPHYLLPLCPAFALLAARLLEEEPMVRRWHVFPPLAVLVLVGIVLMVGPLLAGDRRLPSWSRYVSPGVGALLLLAVAGFVVWFARIFPGRPAAPTLITLAFLLALHAGFAEVARRAYNLEPVSQYLAVVERQGRPIAYVGAYHGQFHFLGRLERPFEVIDGGAEHAWLLSHPRGRIIQDLDYMPPGIGRAEFTQPYRDDVLAVWGLDALPVLPSG
ncbi:MAG TPA: glycosyltransferase family 39 protein [Thermoanaerobaculia bacterium]|nr:glycosyltransferase family 39 protein [Thermoanaerobaculia bacterium]